MATLSSILPPVSVSTASGTLPVTNGGTGLTSPGTAGNILTSDGTNWTSASAVVSYPQNVQSGDYTLVLADAGKHIYSANTGAQTITIPANASVAFPIGTLITIVNQGTTSILLSGAGVSVFPEGSAVAVTSPIVPAGATGQLVKVDTNSWEAIVGVVQAGLVNYVVVGGGAGNTGAYGGGGGGGVVTGASNFELGVLTVTVGAQGSGGNAGANSSLSGSTTILARSASAARSNASIPEGLQNYFYDGTSYFTSGGGGGGAGGAGGNGSGYNGVGAGGIGLLSTITGTPVYYGAGGDGGYYLDSSTFQAGSPGSGSVVVISVPLSEYSGTRTGSPAVTRAGNNAVLRFTSSGTYTAAVGGGIFYSADMLVIAGGGGGGTNSGIGGGGGAGGYLPSTQTLFRGVTYAVTVGAGGSVPFNTSFPAGDGTNSTVAALSLTALGGGGGGSSGSSAGRSGGSGGGATVAGGGGTIAGGAATQPTSASGGFGNAGGTSSGANTAAGGGGAGGAGASSAAGGAGGVGLSSSITGTAVTRAVGGSRTGSAGTANTGNGGAGGPTVGGSGVVIISVPTAFYNGTTTGSPVVTTSGSNTILQFNSSGSYTA